MYPSLLPSGDGANLGGCALVRAVVLLTGASWAHAHTMMWSDELQADLSSLKASRIFARARASGGVYIFALVVFMCAHMAACCLYVRGFQQTTQHQLSQFPRTSLSPSYLILQELTVCRYHTALQPAGSWINPKMSGRLNHLFGSCWFRWKWSCSNAELSTICCSHFGLLCAKKYFFFPPWFWHSVLCLLQ